MIFMDSYKVIIFDLDGTLFYKDQMISDNTAKKIIELEEKGIVIGLATGRFLNELDSFIEQLQLKKYQGFVICANGAEVNKKKKKSGDNFLNDLKYSVFI